MNITDKIQLLGILNESARKEAELTWTRFQAMLLASTGLLAILSYALEKDLRWVVYGLCALGIIFAAIWLQIIRMSKYYYARWQADADELVRSDQELRQLVRGRIDPRVLKPTRFAATTYSMILPITFFLGWLVILVTTSLGILVGK